MQNKAMSICEKLRLPSFSKLTFKGDPKPQKSTKFELADENSRTGDHSCPP